MRLAFREIFEETVYNQCFYHICCYLSCLVADMNSVISYFFDNEDLLAV